LPQEVDQDRRMRASRSHTFVLDLKGSKYRAPQSFSICVVEFLRALNLDARKGLLEIHLGVEDLVDSWSGSDSLVRDEDAPQFRGKIATPELREASTGKNDLRAVRSESRS